MLFFLLHLQNPALLSLDLAKPGAAVSPTIYGQMTEEINYSNNGGLYAELVRNRAEPMKVSPATSKLVGLDNRFSQMLAPYSVTVLKLRVSK